MNGHLDDGGRTRHCYSDEGYPSGVSPAGPRRRGDDLTDRKRPLRRGLRPAPVAWLAAVTGAAAVAWLAAVTGAALVAWLAALAWPAVFVVAHPPSVLVLHHD